MGKDGKMFWMITFTLTISPEGATWGIPVLPYSGLTASQSRSKQVIRHFQRTNKWLLMLLKWCFSRLRENLVCTHRTSLGRWGWEKQEIGDITGMSGRQESAKSVHSSSSHKPGSRGCGELRQHLIWKHLPLLWCLCGFVLKRIFAGHWVRAPVFQT